MKKEDVEAQTDFVIAMRKEEISQMPGVVGVVDGLHHGSFVVASVGTSNDGRNGISLALWTVDGPMEIEPGDRLELPIWDESILPLADMLISARERVEEARVAKAMAEKPDAIN